MAGEGTGARLRAICVFCGSSPGRNPAYLDAAARLGEALARRGVGLIYGGAQVGLMGRVADSVLAHGGRVVGIIPGFLASKEIAHAGLTELVVVGSMHERKAQMAQRSDAFLALPGGFGTFEELFEMLTWSQLGLHRKPCGVLNIAGYYDPLGAQLDRAVADGFMKPEHRQLAIVDDDLDRLLGRLAAFQPPPSPKWLDLPQT